MRHFALLLSLSSVLLLSGCSSAPVLTGTSTTPGTPSGSVRGAAITGRVHGGQNPVSAAHVYLLAVSNSGYGGPGIAASSTNASVSLLTTGTGQDSLGYYVTTASDGSFSISGDYTCPSSYAIPYLYAAGGSAGSGNNSAITLVGPVGSCPTSSEYVVVNEVTTVAAVYSFAGFASSPINVSSSSTSLAATGLSNAGATLLNLVAPGTGVAEATTAGSNGAVPQAEVNTLANILAACVNSAGSTSMQCNTLFTNAENNGNPAPDTATAALNIAHNPGVNVGNLFGLQAGNPPFAPMLSSAPNDFTIAVSYSGGGLDGPNRLAVDGSGNVWVENASSNGVSEFSPTGIALSGSTGYTGGGLNDPGGIAIDSSGDAWVVDTNPFNNGLSELNGSGMGVSGSPFTGGGLSNPEDLAIDSLGDVWVSNPTGSSLSEFSSSGAAKSGTTGYTGGGLDAPRAIAIDASGNVWVASNNDNSLNEFSSTGTPISSSSGFKGGGLSDTQYIAIDGSGNVWATNYGGSSVSEFNSSGTAISASSGFTGGGLSLPIGIAIDGSGNVWVANSDTVGVGNDIAELAPSGAPITGSSGYEGGGLDKPTAIAIDGSGNLWVSSSLNNIVEFVGAATPVVTPIVANLASGHAVNRP
ncbi:MAG: NHL repeat-containing protein [Terracidiphilus sp.]